MVRQGKQLVQKLLIPKILLDFHFFLICRFREAKSSKFGSFRVLFI
jgi:hypothetical protein